MNLILLTIDCLRADHLSCLGYSKKTTPNLDNLASASALFTQAISVGSSTPSSFIAMFTSSYPLMYGGKLWITDSRTTLAQVLKEHGYHTAAFHSNPWISSYHGYHKGFDTFDDSFQKGWRESLMRKPKGLIKRIGGINSKLYELLSKVYVATMVDKPYAKAEVLNKEAISWLKDNANNFFLWLHYMDVHEPYFPPKRIISPLEKYRLYKLEKKRVENQAVCRQGKLKNSLIYMTPKLGMSMR